MRFFGDRAKWPFCAKLTVLRTVILRHLGSKWPFFRGKLTVLKMTVLDKMTVDQNDRSMLGPKWPFFDKLLGSVLEDQNDLSYGQNDRSLQSIRIKLTVLWGAKWPLSKKQTDIIRVRENKVRLLLGLGFIRVRVLLGLGKIRVLVFLGLGNNLV